METIDLLKNTKVSYFGRATYANPLKDITLYEWIYGQYMNKYHNKINEARKLYEQYKNCAEAENKNERKKIYQKFKQDNLCAISLSATFTENRRMTNENANFTGVIALDIDGYDGDLDELKRKMIKLPYCMLCAKSVSGNGIFCMIYYNKERDFKRVFSALRNDMNDMGIAIDEQCSDYTRLRYVTWDEKILIKKNVDMYDKESDFVHHTNSRVYKDGKVERKKNPILNKHDTLETLVKCIGWLVHNGYGKDGFEYYSFKTKKTKYDYTEWMKDGMRLSSLFDDDIGLKLFTYISENASGFVNCDDVKDKFMTFCNYTSTENDILYYFALCKKKLGQNWRKQI